MRSMIGVVLGLSLALAAVSAPADTRAASLGEGTPALTRSERFAALEATAAKRGEVALIVRLDRFDSPLPALPPAAQQSRLDAIRASREQLLADLVAWGRLGNIKRFQYSPFVAFTADAKVI